MFDFTNQDHEDLLNLIFKHNGKIVGGYAREWARENNYTNIGWKDIDLLFDNDFFLNDFKKEFESKNDLFKKFSPVVDYRYTNLHINKNLATLNKNTIYAQSFLNHNIYHHIKIFYSCNHFYIDNERRPKIKGDFVGVKRLYLYDIKHDPETWQKFAKEKINIFLYHSLYFRDIKHEKLLIDSGWRLKIKDQVYDRSNYKESLNLN